MTCYRDKKGCKGFNISHRDFLQEALCDVMNNKQTLYVPPDMSNL